MTCVRDISNPVSLARLVMDTTGHVMLAGEGANQFAAEMGVPKVDASELVTPEARRVWEEFSRYNSVVTEFFNAGGEEGGGNLGHDTVGAVALDISGNLAAATSTGGISLKRVGRVGDTPLIGAGACCDNDLGGVSCTGHGESIAKVLLAQRVLSQLKSGGNGGDSKEGVAGLQGACVKALGYMLERVGGRGGVIGISKSGEVAKHWTTVRMPWASVEQGGVTKSGI